MAKEWSEVPLSVVWTLGARFPRYGIVYELEGSHYRSSLCRIQLSPAFVAETGCWWSHSAVRCSRFATRSSVGNMDMAQPPLVLRIVLSSRGLTYALSHTALIPILGLRTQELMHVSKSYNSQHCKEQLESITLTQNVWPQGDNRMGAKSGDFMSSKHIGHVLLSIWSAMEL